MRGDRDDDNARSRMDMIESVGVRPDTIWEEGEFRERLPRCSLASAVGSRVASASCSIRAC